MLTGRKWIMLLALWPTMLGCGVEPRASETPDPVPGVSPIGASFNAESAGTIEGTVAWRGDIPKAQEHLTRRIAYSNHNYQIAWQTPHIPKVDAALHGIEDAVVFLREVDATRSRPWDLEPVRIEIDDQRLRIRQGKNISSVGFVPRGDSVDVVNIDTKYHNLHGGGAAFFGLPLFKQNAVHRLTMRNAGVVDLRCAAGYYWLHAHLFVVSHPYYVRTDRAGRFKLADVPPGDYEVVSWLPSWHIEREERDPETGIIARFVWKAPVEQTQKISVSARAAATVHFQWDAGQFDK